MGRLSVACLALAACLAASPRAARAQACAPGNPATCENLFSAACYPHMCTLINAPPYVYGYFCLPTMAQASGGQACEADADPCTTDACGAGDGLCQHTTAPDGTACGANRTCSGGACACSGGYKDCNGGCIPNAMCCVDGDCPGNAANHQHGVCGAGGCVLACDGGYKPCGAACIPNATCCDSTQCVTPPNGCYKTQGTCGGAGGSCSYPFNNGVACNADGTLCTPNDKCSNGTCVADTAHLVVCVQEECHGPPACNPGNGLCESTIIGGGCGGNGCTPAGSCSAGTCSTAAQTKDCSAQTSLCKVGVCDPTNGNCTSANLLNGTACNVADKCVQSPVCSGGSCEGARTECTPSAPCLVADCNATTGACEEAVAPVGTSCSIAGACVQNATCDATGTCVGDTVPDGTPCEQADCEIAAACVSSACVCVGKPGTGGPADGPDMGAGLGDGAGEDEGCAMAGHAPPLGAWWLVASALLVSLRRRRR